MYTNNDKEKRIEIFEDTLRLCGDDPKLAEAIRASRAGTEFYPADEYPDIKKAPGERAAGISVTAERTLEAAKRLLEKYPGKRAAVLNFASATNPGGGVARGSSAQEESLCRCTTLYPCLKTNELYGRFYSMHKAQADARYTDACVYTPEIISIKSDDRFPRALPEKERFAVDVITCAAPNLRERPYNSMNPGRGAPVKVSAAELPEIHKKRGAHILSIAAAKGADVLILGAFGCGAFRNDPNVVAKAYREIIPEYENYFEEIVFAVYCAPNDTGNYETFKRVLAP